MWLDNVIFEGESIEDKRLELGAKNRNYYLGPNLTLRRCTLILRVPTRRLHLTGPRLIDCTIEVKQELKTMRWYTAFLKGCRFTGRLSGNDFGRWPEAKGFEEIGGIEDCDFTAAVLDGCRFLGCDMKSIKLPRWPCFTILNPYHRRQELLAFAWPGNVRAAMDFTWTPESTAALTYSAPALAKRSGTTPEAIRATLEQLDGVLF
jgi:hypothetical protein